MSVLNTHDLQNNVKNQYDWDWGRGANAPFALPSGFATGHRPGAGVQLNSNLMCSPWV